ncbi:hypothetical protein QTP88_020021 [Uroleucon formosanum]
MVMYVGIQLIFQNFITVTFFGTQVENNIVPDYYTSQSRTSPSIILRYEAPSSSSLQTAPMYRCSPVPSMHNKEIVNTITILSCKCERCCHLTSTIHNNANVRRDYLCLGLNLAKLIIGNGKNMIPHEIITRSGLLALSTCYQLKYHLPEFNFVQALIAITTS